MKRICPVCGHHIYFPNNTCTRCGTKIIEIETDTYYQKKKDQGKPVFSLITTEELKALSGPYTYGLIKYNKDEWKQVKDPEKRYEDAFWRHFIAYKDGDLIDEESDLPHIDMAFWNLGKLVYFSKHKDKE